MKLRTYASGDYSFTLVGHSVELRGDLVKITLCAEEAENCVEILGPIDEVAELTRTLSGGMRDMRKAFRKTASTRNS